VIEADAGALGALITRASGLLATPPPVRLYLLAGTSLLAEGWRERVPRLEMAGACDAPPTLAVVIREAGAGLGLEVVWESPLDVVPLPAGWERRARPVPPACRDPHGRFEVRHFDPYSVLLRVVARGDERDYVVALEYLRRGWVEWRRLERLLTEVVPRFTSATLAQDPEEFRRKFKGLRQLYTRNASLTDPSRAGILAPARSSFSL